MALARELRSYINKKYDEKISEIEKNKSTTIQDAAREHNKAESKRGKELCEALLPQILAVKKTIEDAGFSSNYLSNISSVNYIYNIRDFSYELKEKVKKPFDEEITKLNKERDKLLIKLSLEKDFERISAILAEHSIEL